MAAQHGQARQPFLHYSSPRLRRDAQHQLEDIINRFQTLYSGLVSARRQDALEMHGQMLSAKAEAAEVQQKLAQVQEEKQTAEIEAQQAYSVLLQKQMESERQIAQYKALLDAR